jgi:hypothetical protein
MVSFPQASPTKPYAHLSPSPYTPHAQPISFFFRNEPTDYNCGPQNSISYPKGRTHIVSQNRALEIPALKTEGIMGRWRKLESFMIHTLHFVLTLLL